MATTFCTLTTRAPAICRPLWVSGIGLGSVAGGYLSRGKIEMGLIPIRGSGNDLSSARCFYFSQPAEVLAGWLSAVAFHQGSSMATKLGALIVAAVRLRIPDLSLLGFFGGFFAVPLNAMIQHRPRQEQKGGVIAVANLLSFVGVFLARGLLSLFGWVPPNVRRSFRSTAPFSRWSPPPSRFICCAIPCCISSANRNHARPNNRHSMFLNSFRSYITAVRY